MYPSSLVLLPASRRSEGFVVVVQGALDTGIGCGKAWIGVAGIQRQTDF
jgi:hypothetical protein